MAADGFGFDEDKRMQLKYDKKIPPRDPGNLLRAPSLHWYPLEMHRYPLEKGIWCRREIPTNSILAAASK
jgi:hypothetical protein